jgi:hypothetical protein
MSRHRDVAADVPVWLLDIDGVVNAVSTVPVESVWPADTWLQRIVPADIPELGRMVLPILAARPVLDFVRRVVDAGAAEVHWHSTWREAAVSDLAPALGLPAIPVSVAPEWTQRPVGMWWKLPAAQRVVASGRRLVWTDDDIAMFAPELDEFAGRDDALLIAPGRDTGLAPDELDRIAAFLGLAA